MANSELVKSKFWGILAKLDRSANFQLRRIENKKAPKAPKGVHLVKNARDNTGDQKMITDGGPARMRIRENSGWGKDASLIDTRPGVIAGASQSRAPQFLSVAAAPTSGRQSVHQSPPRNTLPIEDVPRDFMTPFDHKNDPKLKFQCVTDTLKEMAGKLLLAPVDDYEVSFEIPLDQGWLSKGGAQGENYCLHTLRQCNPKAFDWFRNTPEALGLLAYVKDFFNCEQVEVTRRGPIFRLAPEVGNCRLTMPSASSICLFVDQYDLKMLRSAGVMFSGILHNIVPCDRMLQKLFDGAPESHRPPKSSRAAGN